MSSCITTVILKWGQNFVHRLICGFRTALLEEMQERVVNMERSAGSRLEAEICLIQGKKKGGGEVSSS